MMLKMMTMPFTTQFKVNEGFNFYLLSMLRTLDDKSRNILATREDSMSMIVTNTLTVYLI